MRMRWRAWLFAVVVLAACEPPDDEAILFEELRVCADGPTVEGIDVSHWQGTIDWDAVAATDVRFAYVRVSDGVGTYDDQFDRNWAEVRRVGLYRGVYQFFRASQDPIAQADLLLEHMGPLEPDDLPPAIDVETDDGATLDQAQHNIRAWIARVEEATGRRPIVYSGLYAWPSVTGSMDVRPSLLWVPQYGPTCPDIPAPWTRWEIFQYTGSGMVDGIGGRVDRDRFNGDEAALRVFAGVDAQCGDGLCTGTESAQACPRDCPTCETIPPDGRTVEETELCFERWGRASGYRTVEGEGSGGSLVWTYAVATASAVYAYWHFDFEEAGQYRLEVHTPAPYGQSVMAPYLVRHAGAEDPVVLDQSTIDGWQVIGEYAFDAGGDQWVQIADGTGEPAADRIQLVMDAVRLTRLDRVIEVDAGVSDAGVLDVDAGVQDDAGMRPPEALVLRGTCGCVVTGRREPPPFIALAMLMLLVGRRRNAARTRARSPSSPRAE